MKKLLALALALLACGMVQAQETKVAVGISGWTGFAPLTLAKEAGIFKKNGLDVSIKKIPQKDRHLAIASGDVQCAATTVEPWILRMVAGLDTPTSGSIELDGRPVIGPGADRGMVLQSYTRDIRVEVRRAAGLLESADAAT